METEPKIGSPALICVSWAAAAVAFPLALVVAAVGQGLGALAGGCQWIGLSLPLGRQVWALVNQPVINFSSSPSASGYWLGSLILPLIIASGIIPLLPRANSMLAELSVVQTAWGSASVAGAWLPLLEYEDGHLARWLAFQDWPQAAVWVAPILASVIALVPALRLLEMARRRQTSARSIARFGVVAIHLGIPLVAWVGVAALVRGSLPVAATLGAALPLAVSLTVAWLRYPAPYVRPLEPATPFGVIGILAAATLLFAFVWFAGRPLPEGRSAGILWGPPQAFNNIRPWIDPASPLPGGQ
jgi:hypothetical protein